MHLWIHCGTVRALCYGWCNYYLSWLSRLQNDVLLSASSGAVNVSRRFRCCSCDVRVVCVLIGAVNVLLYVVDVMLCTLYRFVMKLL